MILLFKLIRQNLILKYEINLIKKYKNNLYMVFIIYNILKKKKLKNSDYLLIFLLFCYILIHLWTTTSIIILNLRVLIYNNMLTFLIFKLFFYISFGPFTL